MGMKSITILFISTIMYVRSSSNPSQILDGRIVGGRNTTIKEFPYQLSLQYKEQHCCGAAILTRTIALTTAFCTVGKDPKFFRVRAGSSRHDSGGETVEVQTLKIHPLFNATTMDYDVCVLLLKNFLTKGKNIKLQPMNKEVPVDTKATVAGWGSTSEEGSIVTILQKITLVNRPHRICVKIYKDFRRVTLRMSCYYVFGVDTCDGDSGSPIVFKGLIVGLVSWGYGCNRFRFPGIYTNVANPEISKFIEEHLTRNI